MLLSSILILLILMLSALLHASDEALSVSSDSKIQLDVDKGNKRAMKVSKYLEEDQNHTTSTLVLTTLLTLINGAIALNAFSNDVMQWFQTPAQWIEPLVVVLIALVLLMFHVVFGQMIPKRLANKHSESIAYATIGFVLVMTKVLAPFVWFFTLVSHLFGRLFGLLPNEGERKVTEEEIRTIIEEGSKTGDIDEEESEMIQNIFDFSDTTVDDIMTHRTEIAAIDVKSTKKQIIDYVKKEQFTRFPVYQGSIDHIVGTLHVKDLLKYIDNPEEKFSIKDLIRPPYFIPESKKTSDLFKEMQLQKNHIAVVLDEYGGTAGIVTIEDLIEEIVGNISDEYDEDEHEVIQIDEESYEIDGLMSIHDVEDKIEADLPVEDYDTLSGFILGQLGRFPEDNESILITFNGFTFEVLAFEDKVIAKVKVTKPKDLMASSNEGMDD